MRKVFIILLCIPFLVSCKSKEDKIQDLIREQMFQTLYDYKSYEPIETTELKEELHSLENDSTIITFVKEYTKGEVKIGNLSTEQRDELQEVLDNVLDRREKYLKFSEQFEKHYGYSVIHKFRAKNKGGVYDIYTKKYLIDKDLTRIIWEYSINDNDKVKSNLKYIIERWNESKLWKSKNIDFLEENKNKEGVITTESGLQYKIIKQGRGAVPSKNSIVSLHHKGRLIDGTEFDDSYQYNFILKYKVNKALNIRAMSEILTMMPVGSKWEVYIPQELGWGARTERYGRVKPYSTLIGTIHNFV